MGPNKTLNQRLAESRSQIHSPSEPIALASQSLNSNLMVTDMFCGDVDGMVQVGHDSMANVNLVGRAFHQIPWAKAENIG